MSKHPPVPLLEAIKKASSTDLEAIDSEIAGKQAEIDERVADLDRLKQLRKTVNVLINGKPPRKTREVKQKPAEAKLPGVSTEDRRRKVAEYLAKHGASKPMEIAADLEIPGASITFILSTSAFAKTPQGIVLTPEGRQLYLES
jgi:hypothetical protein